MLVKCDKCGQSYEVNETRIPPKGARIKCPSCANVFMVRPGGVSEPINDKPSVSNSSGLTPDTPSVIEASETLWKVRHLGLTYTFHDLASLHEWLSARQTLDDVKVARDDEDWKELGDYPDVMTTELITRFFPLGDVPTSKGAPGGHSEASGSDKEPGDGLRSPSVMNMASGSPVGVSMDLSEPVASSSLKNSRKAQKERIQAQEAQRKQNKKLVYVIILVVLAVGCAVVGLRYVQTGHLPWTSPEMPGVAEPVHVNVIEDEPEPARPAKAKQDVDETANKAPQPDAKAAPSAEDIEALAELELQKQLAEAETMVQNRQWPEARTTLEQLVKEMPDHLEALQMLSKTYRGLGLNDKAAEVDSQIRKVKASQK